MSPPSRKDPTMQSQQLLSQLAQQHQADARRSAAAARPARTAVAAQHAALRSRAGWTLVQIGLRLAGQSADA
jgi:hypothetical protein